MDLLKDIPKQYVEVISDIIEEAKSANIRIRLEDSPRVKYQDETSECGGYFTDEPELEFVVAVGRPIEEWMPLFIHEACHMEQYIEDIYMWKKLGVSIEFFFEWLEGKIELSKDRVTECVLDAIALEKDCEERVVRTIKQYNLPISVVEYTQKANTYLYSYWLYADKREWFEGLYSNPKIYKKAPKEFKSSYKKVPSRLKQSMESYYLSIRNVKK